MARPKTKDELIEQSNSNYDRLVDQIHALTPEQRSAEFPKEYLNRNIRDVICHLHHWHLLFMNWYEQGKRDIKPDMPAKGYTWKTTPELNRDIQRKYSEETLNSALLLFEDSHNRVMRIINRHTNEELFTKEKYKWTGSTSMGSYLVSNSSSHYDWAYKLIKKALVL